MSTGLVSNAPLMDLHQCNVWEKPLWKKDTFKDTGNRLTSFLEISLSHRWFWYILLVQMFYFAQMGCQITITEFLWFHYQPKRVIVYCKSFFHGRTSVYEEYIECILVLVIQLPEFQETNSGKRKIRHAAIVAIFWENCSKILRPNMNGEHFEKTNIKTTITYNNIFLC